MAADVIVRECVSSDDFKQCIELERSVWKDDDIDIMPARLYMISRACNAPTFGAFDPSGRMVGFGHTMMALIGASVAYHSHMLAVVEELRDKDVGYKIKLAQRDRAIQTGVPLIFWTFDPLQSRNAHFNINKLGVVVRRYEDNYYGQGVSTVFDSQVPSDRLIAEWWVSSPHVQSVLAGKPPAVAAGSASVLVPDNIDAIRAVSVQEHRRWRFKVREQFKEELARGALVRGFRRQPEQAISRYFFGPDESQFHFDDYGGLR